MVDADRLARICAPLLGWLALRLDGWAARVQRREMASLVDRLQVSDARTLGLLVAAAAHVRNQTVGAAPALKNPIATAAKWPMLACQIALSISAMQKQGRTLEALAWTVWLNTLRGATRPGLRPLARAMWGELARLPGSGERKRRALPRHR